VPCGVAVSFALLTRPGKLMSQDKRILVVSPQPFYEDRGTPIAVRRLLEAAQVCGIKADLLSFPIGRDVAIGDVRQYRCSNPFRLQHVPIGLSWRKLLLDCSLLPAVISRLHSGAYCGIHALEEAAFFCIPLARRFRIPVVYDMQSSMPEQLQRYAPLRAKPVQAVFRRCEKWLLQHADFVMCSEGLAETVRTAAPEARVREWRYATPPADVAAADIVNLKRELGVPEQAHTVVYTGTFEHYQGLSELVAAAPYVCAKRPDTVFVLAGAVGSLDAPLKRQALMLGLNGHMKIVPRQPVERINVFQQMADVLVSPRRFGGNTPLKVFDYLAAGKPIVATNVTSHTAVLDDRMAVLVEPNAQGLAQGILTVLTDSAMADRLVGASRELAEQVCGWKPFVESIKGLFEEVQAHGASRSQRVNQHRERPLVISGTHQAPSVLHHPRS
jgi:glycosyltransferase involved in cell wall biosynthesis